MPAAPAKTRTVQADFYPAAVGSDETKLLFAVDSGDRVVSVQAIPLTAAAASTQSTFTLGDGADPDGFLTALDTETMVPFVPLNGNGAYFTGGAGNRLYTASDTIDCVYDQTTPGATNPGIRFIVQIEKA